MKEKNIHRVAFADFWPGFNPHDNLFQRILNERLNITVVNGMEQADFLIYSVFGHSHRNFPGIRLFYTAESVMPNWNECDGAVTFMRHEEPLPGLHLRMPNWVANYDIFHARTVERHSLDPADILQRHTKFCNFIYSNPHAQERICFFKHLSRYKHIHSGGKILNNMGHLVGNAFEFSAHFKFSIAFENVASRGYVTEKLMRAFSAGSLPIYWGDPDIARDVNPHRFIHARDFAGPEELADYIAEIDNNDELYLSYFREPLFLPGQRNFAEYADALEHFISQTIAQGIVRHRHQPHADRHPCAHGYPSMPVYDDGKPWKRLPTAQTRKPMPARPAERIIHCIHPKWTDTLSIRGNRAERQTPPHDAASILDLTDDAIRLKWDRWGEEHFIISGASFHLKSIKQEPSSIQPNETDTRISLISNTSRPPLTYLFGTPYHPNLGDHAQTECLLHLLKRHFPHHETIFSTLLDTSPRLLAAIRKHIRKDDLILCLSGYHLTDLYNEQSVYLELCKLFPDYPIRILPQTICYKNQRIAEKTAAILNEHPNCTLFCRDEQSLKTAQNLFHRCRLILYPDLVTAMIGRMSLPPQDRKGVLFCMRSDKETKYPTERTVALRQEVDRIIPTSFTDTNLNRSGAYVIAHRAETIRDTILRFSQYQAVVTDRFHGTIFSLIANTPVIILASIDHKITSGLKWFPDTFKQHIHFAETPEQIPSLLRTILQKGLLPPLPDYFASHYHDRFMEYLSPTAPPHLHENP